MNPTDGQENNTLPSPWSQWQPARSPWASHVVTVAPTVVLAIALREQEQQKPWLLATWAPVAVVAQPQVGLAARDPATQDLTALLAPVSTTACQPGTVRHHDVGSQLLGGEQPGMQGRLSDRRGTTASPAHGSETRGEPEGLHLGGRVVEGLHVGERVGGVHRGLGEGDVDGLGQVAAGAALVCGVVAGARAHAVRAAKRAGLLSACFWVPACLRLPSSAQRTHLPIHGTA